MEGLDLEQDLPKLVNVPIADMSPQKSGQCLVVTLNVLNVKLPSVELNNTQNRYEDYLRLI